MTRGRLWLVAHGLAVAGAAFSLVVLVPHPELWQHLPGAPQAYAFTIERAGPLHIVLGAAAMLTWSWRALGPRFALVFLGSATGVSLVFELVGTGTGWPFGQYAYTSGLGAKILDRVPFSIPLSWYYLGLASWVLAREALRRWWPSAGPWAAVALGTWLLMAWDLVLDPAMAHPDLPIRFWRWHERGAYLGMPLINLVSWTVCGALFMGAARFLAGEPPAAAPGPAFVVYAVNVGFGVALCASLGLWAPIGLAFVAGLAPAALALRGPRGS
jgi:putative membrane protein